MSSEVEQGCLGMCEWWRDHTNVAAPLPVSISWCIHDYLPIVWTPCFSICTATIPFLLSDQKVQLRSSDMAYCRIWSPFPGRLAENCSVL